MDEIAAEAEVSQKTFFNHFATKQVLLGELAHSVVSHFERLLSQVCKETDSVEGRLEAFFLEVASEVETSRVLTRDMLHQIIRGASSEDLGSAELRRVREGFRDVLAEQRSEEHGPTRERELEFQADLVTGAFIGVILQWLNEPGYPLRERMRETARFLGNALAAATPGRRLEI